MKFRRGSASIINFTWHVFCDHYLEVVKYRLAHENPYKRSAQKTLYTVLLNILKLISPFTPHIAEEIYHTLYAKYEGWRSITISDWPKVDKIDEESIARGDVIIKTIANMRRVKHNLKIPLNQPVTKATIYAGRYTELLKDNLDDIANTLWIRSLEVVEEGKGKYEVKEYPEITFDILR